jgi:predicted transcriptional regulator
LANAADTGFNIENHINELLDFCEINEIFHFNTIEMKITLHSNFQINEKHFFEKKSKLNVLSKFDRSFIYRFMLVLYHKKRKYIEFQDLQEYYINHSKKIEDTQNQEGNIPKNKKDNYPSKEVKKIDSQSYDPEQHYFFENYSDTLDGSDHRLKTPTERWNQLANWIEEKKVDFGVWISKINRDHNKNPQGQLNINSELFRNLCTHYISRYSPNSSWYYAVKNKDNYSFTFSFSKKGRIRIWIKEGVDWSLFIQHYFKEFDFLPFEQQSELLINFEKSNEMFILETANTIGPESLIDDNFKGACVAVKKIFHKGKLHTVYVWIDYSKGHPEIEFKGPEDICRRLQEIITRPVEIAQTLGYIEQMLEQFFDVYQLTDNKLDELAILINVSGNEIKDEIQELKETTDNNIQTLIRGVNAGFTRNENGQEVLHNDHLQFNENLNNGVTTIVQTIADTNQEQLNHREETTQELLEQMNKGTTAVIKEVSQVKKKIEDSEYYLRAQVREIKGFIQSEFSKHTKTFHNNLSMILAKIQQLPGKTIDEYFNQLSMKKGTLYNKLKFLSRNGIIEPTPVNNFRRGRSKLTYKIKDKFLKKIKEDKND